MNDLAPSDQPPAAQALLQGALIDSRQRWRDLITLGTDFAFETDPWDRLVLVAPDPALGWSANDLVGQSAAALLAEGGGNGGVFNPFRVSARVRHRQAWLRRADGGVACLTFCTEPIRDPDGRVTGVRGTGIDMTELDVQAAQVAAALRRAEVLDHILWRMGQEVLAPRMMAATLDALVNAMGGEGAAVVRHATSPTATRLSHMTGTGAEAIVDSACQHLMPGDPRPRQIAAADGRQLLLAACETRSGDKAGLTVWRLAATRAWDREDALLLGSAVNVVRMILEHEATQQEMARQARTDSLTGLLNRRAFLEETERHAARLDRESQPGTLIFVDLDHFKPVNDRLGHETGDHVLRRTAALLRRTFRPTDLVARLGGDEFAVWLNGADHMTAAERAEYLRDTAPAELAEVTGPDAPRLSMSIGIASREAGDDESLESLMRRADIAMYEVKRGGRGHWRVSLKKRL